MPNPLMELAQAKDYAMVLTSFRDQPLADIAATADFLREDDIYGVAIELYQYLLSQEDLSQEDRGDYHFGLGQCHGKRYEYGLALSHLKRAFGPGRDRTDGANYYAYILERTGSMDEAFDWYQKALGGEGQHDLWTRSHYAWFLEKDARRPEAEQAYQEVLALNPGYTWAIKRYALFLLSDDAGRSRALIDQARERFPNNAFVRLNQLEYFILIGAEDEFASALASLEGLQPAPEVRLVADLFEYFQHDLRNRAVNEAKAVSLQDRMRNLPGTIHRDFDDLTDLLAAEGGDVGAWKNLLQLMLK